MLVIHENKGLNDWVRSVVGRFGGIGYSALGIDLLSAQGGTATFKDPAEATAALGKIPPDQFVADLRSGLDELQRRAPGMKLAVLGFCFGGGLASAAGVHLRTSLDTLTEPVVVAERDRAAYGEAIATATEFSASLVRQAADLLRGIGIDAPGRYLGTLVHSTIDRALTEAGDSADLDDAALP